jgi:hypothetical protein
MEYMSRAGVDVSRLYFDEAFEGLQDLVLIDRHSRTAFGKFQAYFGESVKRWSEPRKEDIEDAAVVGIDPFFFGQSTQAARYCKELGRKYVTIDCRAN